MTAYVDTIGFNKGSAAHRDKSPMAYCVSVNLDFAAIKVARLAAGASILATNDSLAIIQVPAKTFVIAVGLDITTANTNAGTVDVGGSVEANVDSWIDGVDPTSTGSAVGLGTLYGTNAAGNYQNAADTLDMLFLTGPQDTSVMRLWAVMVDCAGPE